MFALSEESKVRETGYFPTGQTGDANGTRSELPSSLTFRASLFTSYTRSDPRPSIIRYAYVL
ncbi:hypothetical protein VCV18_002209 [Metarhizium anisopliae]